MFRKITKVCIYFFLLISILTACGGGDNGGNPPGNNDTTPPLISSSLPLDETLNVVVDGNIRIVFSEKIKADSLTADSFTVSNNSTAITGTISLDEDATAASFIPDADLEENTTYTITVTTSVRDLAGNPLAKDYSSTFTTGVFSITVQTLYSAASNWNSYITDDGENIFNASNTTCEGTTTPCIHGAELVSFTVPGYETCANLSATDSLDVFSWVCDQTTNPIRMISNGLKENKNLSDLINFNTSTWLSISVTLYENDSERFSLAPATWWGNSIITNNSGGNLDSAGNIYLITLDTSSTYTIGADHVSLLIKPGITLNGPATGTDIISANNRKFLWLEGSIDAVSDDRGIVFENIGFSVLRNIDVKNANTGDFSRGIHLINSSFNKLTNIRTENHRFFGLRLDTGSNNNTVKNITASNNGLCGIYGRDIENNNFISLFANGNLCGIYFYSNSNNNKFRNLVTANNQYGVYLRSSTNNRLDDIKTYNNSVSGLHIDASSSNYLNNILSTNNGATDSNGGVVLNGQEGAVQGNTLSNVTVANNYYSGVYIYQASNNNLLNVASLNNGRTNLEFGGVMFNGANSNTLANLAASHGYYGISFWSSENNHITGQLNLGNNNPGSDCHIDLSSTAGLTSSCTNNGTSNAVYVTDTSLASSFIGKVITDDSQNSSQPTNEDGTTDYANISDWFSFENTFRNWGIDGNAFPASNQQGSCTAGNCRIWDWSVLGTDNIIHDVLSVPLAGDISNITSHTWQISPAPTGQADCDNVVNGSQFNVDHCESTFLRNTVEINTDNIGNNNGLCESGETCLYTPNIGHFQGQGNLISAGDFVNGVLTDIILLKYESNSSSTETLISASLQTNKPIKTYTGRTAVPDTFVPVQNQNTDSPSKHSTTLHIE
ncbi:MAG: Ig-like domain-containing protein [Gammaproteobacteria bacterium]|nr:Ig-like domain-containing protein [Gammaproteobacteria bacterium]